MKITRTIELEDADRLAISKVLAITDKIAIVTGCSMGEVFEYFLDKSEILSDNTFSITALHQIDDIG